MTTDCIRIAAFDVDGTLTRRDCVVPFLWRVGGLHSIGRGVTSTGPLLSAVCRRDRDDVKAIGTDAAFRDQIPDEVTALGERYAHDIARRWLRTDTTELLRRHLANGDTVVFVSASYEVYLRPLARLLDVEHVLAARLEVGANGRYTGQLDGPNCRGAEKVRRLDQWRRETVGSDRPVWLTAYGDSRGDRELLAQADVAHWVSDRRLSPC